MSSRTRKRSRIEDKSAIRNGYCGSCKPASSKDLALHHSKVKAIKVWLENACKAETGSLPRLLVLVGPSGSGKSTAVETLCKELDIVISHMTSDSIIEEALSGDISTSASKGPGWHSAKTERIEELASTALRANYPSLSFSSSQTIAYMQPSSRRVCLLHDSPDVLAAMVSREDSPSPTSVTAILLSLLSSDRPLIVIVSDVSGQDDAHFALSNVVPAEVRSAVAMETIFCPPITQLQTRKVLDRALESMIDLRNVPSSFTLDEIAATSGGDVRHAILALQLQCSGNAPKPKPLIAHTSKHNNSSNKGKLENSAARRRPTIMDDIEDSDDSFDAFDIRGTVQASQKSNSNHSTFGGLHARQRDEEISSLHSVAKLLNARLDETGKLDFLSDEVFSRSQFPVDMSLQFMQWNSLESISNIARVAGFLDESFNENTVLEQLVEVTASFSDIDALASSKYAPAAHIERSSETASFPDEYVCGIASRAAAVARGPGFKTKYDVGKSKGGKMLFASLRRPRLLDARLQMREIADGLRRLRNDYASGLRGTEEIDGMGMYLDKVTLAVELQPFLRVMPNVWMRSAPVAEEPIISIRRVALPNPRLSENKAVLDDEILDFD